MSSTDTNDSARRQLRNTGNVLNDVVQNALALVRGEMNLLRAEMDQNVKRAGAAVGMIVAAVVLFLVALNVLANALVVGIAELGLDPALAALIVGVAFAVIAAILAKKGTSDLKLTSLAPTRTTRNVERDREAVRKAL